MNDDGAKSRVQELGRVIEEIRNISGTAGASVGILHQGKILHKANFGYRDVERGVVANSQTIYGIGSMTKAFVAAGMGKLVEEQKLNWTTPIKDILPEWHNTDSAVTSLTTVVDCLAHRTGLPGDYQLTFQGDGDALLPKDQLVPTVNAMQPVTSFRGEWIYSSWGYAIAALVIERLSHSTLNDYLSREIYDPLNMLDTTTQPKFPAKANIAKPYAALSQGWPQPLSSRMMFKDTFFEAAGGAFTSVDDMLRWSSAIFEAKKNPNALLKQTDELLTSHISIPPPTFRERTYGMGWIRTQLPGIVGVMGDNAAIMPMRDLPELGRNSPSMLTLYHQGSTAGYYSSIFLFPETESAIVVLTNSISLCDAADFIGQAYTQALFNFSDGTDYVNITRRTSQKLVSIYGDLTTAMEAQREPYTQAHLMRSYTGRFWNSLHNFVLDIQLHPIYGNCLQVAFQGLESQIYTLRHLRHETFEWSLSLDDEARRGRYHTWHADFYKFHFHTSHDGIVDTVRWAENPYDFPEGQEYTREITADSLPGWKHAKTHAPSNGGMKTSYLNRMFFMGY